MLGNLVGGFIVILIGTTLAPVIATQVWVATTNGTAGVLNGNQTTASATVLGLTTLFYNLAIASSAIGIAAQGLKNSGLM
jgi:hypothetical protein